MNTPVTTTEWEVCRCCYYAAAGYSDHELGEDHSRCQHWSHPLSMMDGRVCPGGRSSDPDGDGDLACRFTWRSCSGCDTPIAGERHYITEFEGE